MGTARAHADSELVQNARNIYKRIADLHMCDLAHIRAHNGDPWHEAADTIASSLLAGDAPVRGSHASRLARSAPRDRQGMSGLAPAHVVEGQPNSGVDIQNDA